MSSKEIPLSSGLPLLGHLFDYKKDRLEMLRKVRESHGDTFKLKVGPKTLIVITQPDDVEYILHKRAQNFIKVGNMNQIFGESVATTNGAEWKKQRVLIQPLLNPKYFSSVFDEIKDITQRNINHYFNHQNDGKDLKDLFAKITYDIILKCMIGLACYERYNEIDAAIKEMTDFISNDKYSFIDLPEFINKKKQIFRKSLKALDNIIYEGIEKAKQSQGSQSLISVLLKEVENNSEIKDKNQFIRDNVFTLLYAGYDTSALTLSWLSSEFAKNPHWIKKCQDEVDSIDFEQLDLSQIKSLPNLEACIAETMRLYPPGWAFTRVAQEKDQLREFKIDKGDIILCSAFLTHRDKLLWENPEKFDPERFIKTKPNEVNRFQFFPFGAGTRICPGKNFGMMEIKVILIYLLQNYTIEQSGEAPVMDARVTLFSKNNFQLKLKKRQSE